MTTHFEREMLHHLDVIGEALVRVATVLERAHPTAPTPTSVYLVGGPDPTPDDGDCMASSPGNSYGCTWYSIDHPAVHVAGDGTRVLALWPVA